MAELTTVLSVEDVFNILEVVDVDAHNAKLIRAHREKQT